MVTTTGKDITLRTEEGCSYPVGMSLTGEKLFNIRNLPQVSPTINVNCSQNFPSGLNATDKILLKVLLKTDLAKSERVKLTFP